MSKNGLTKKQCQRLHARNRFKERHGLNFTRKIEKLFLLAIAEGMVGFVEKQSMRIFVYDVPYNYKLYRVVYDKTRNVIVTVFPDKDFYESAEMPSLDELLKNDIGGVKYKNSAGVIQK